MSTNDRVVHCWKGKREHMAELHGFGSPEWIATFDDDGDGACMLLDGHDGPHEFTPDNEIAVTFSEVTP